MPNTVKIDKIEALGTTDFDKWLEPQRFTYTPKPLGDADVDVRIIACGICGSDLHAVKAAWGRPYCPMATGHEIIGYVVNKGSKVTNVDIGDRVGVGAQSYCCHQCYACQHGHEANCDGVMFTIGTPYGDGTGTQGGNAKYIRVLGEFAFKIPDSLKTEYAAPMMCGGVTGLKPLLRAGVKEGSKVGIVGVGGVGHFSILFAKALGAEVTAISRSNSKKEVATKLGVDHYIATNDKESFPSKYIDTFDVIVNTGSSFSGQGLNDLLFMLRPQGKFVSITIPPAGENIVVPPMTLIHKDLSVQGSSMGDPADIKFMLNLAAEKNVKPWVETLDINEKNLSTAWARMDKGDVRFRFVLVNYEKFFGR